MKIYRTQKGYFYKEYKNGKKKRISKEDYLKLKKKHVMKGGFTCDVCGGYDIFCTSCEPWCPRNWGRGYGGTMKDVFFNIDIDCSKKKSHFYIKCKRCKEWYMIFDGKTLHKSLQDEFDSCKEGKCQPLNDYSVEVSARGAVANGNSVEVSPRGAVANGYSVEDSASGASPKSDYFTIDRVLEEGGYGTVYLATIEYSFKGLYRGDKVVIKRINSSTTYINKNGKSNLNREIKLLKELKHENIVELYDAYNDGRYTYLVMEYLLNYHDLFDMMFTWDKALRINKYSIDTEYELTREKISVLKQVAETLKYIHGKGVIHRDLKLENIMYNEKSDHVKIIDFGLSIKAVKDTRPALTAEYAAPEMVKVREAAKKQSKRKPYNNKIDIWAFGIVAYLVFTGRYIFGGPTHDRGETCAAILDYANWEGEGIFIYLVEALEPLSSCSDSLSREKIGDLIDLIENTLKKNPDERASIDDVLKSPIFS